MTRDREVQREAHDPEAAAGASKLARYRRAYRAFKEDVLVAGEEGADDIRFVWRILTGTEKQEARSAAVARLNQIGLPLELLGAADLEDECAYQILARAMRDPDDKGERDDPYPRPLCADVDELRELVSILEREDLFTRYVDFEEEHDPAPAQLTEAEYAQIERAAKKKPSESLGQLMNFGTRKLATYLLILGAQQPPSDSGSSGSGGPSSEN